MSRRGPTLLDVAEKAGVSKSTVSRVLNDHPHVGMEARRAVEAAARDLGYQPNGVARSLRTRATMTVGLIVTGLRNEVFAAIAQGAERVLSAGDRTLLVGSSDGDPEVELRLVREFLSRGVDGLIMSLVDERSTTLRHALSKVSMPLGLLDRDAHGIHADRVLTDHRLGVQTAMADVLGTGHESVGLLCPPNIVRAGREVLAAFRDAGGKESLVRSGPLTAAFGRQALDDLLDQREPPTALLIAGTQVLAGVLYRLRERGLSVPEDVSLVAYDDSAAATFHNPPISVIQRDTEEIGEVAARLVLERIDGGREGTRKVIVPTRYVARGSVASPRRRVT